MNRKVLIILFTVTGLVIVAAIGAVAYGSASAANKANKVTIQNATVGVGMFDRSGRGVTPSSYSNEELAKALGITVDELSAAYLKANTAALKEAVKQDLITQAQADQITKKGSAFPFGNRWEPWLAESGIDYNALLADTLGISVEKLQAAYNQAYFANIDQAVTDGKLTQEQADLMKAFYVLGNDTHFKSSMQTAYEAAVQQAVKDGVITQAQADLILQNAYRMDSFPVMGGDMGPGGFDGRYGGPGGAPGNPQPPAGKP
jgi:hypothetical protein